MCNLSKGVEQTGIKKGILVSIINLMKNMQLSVQEVMRILEIPESEQAEYVEMIKNEKVD
ncbi:MAG: hypothetical protein IKJ01_02910 [Lachnospiraceae bacterium]|nr:hypothetical protein [Lachnospiraceae bacterium]